LPTKPLKEKNQKAHPRWRLVPILTAGSKGTSSHWPHIGLTELHSMGEVILNLCSKKRRGRLHNEYSKNSEKGEINLQKWQLENHSVMSWLLNTMTM